MVAVAEGMRPTATTKEKNAMPNTVHRRINNLAGFIAALSALLFLPLHSQTALSGKRFTEAQLLNAFPEE